MISTSIGFNAIKIEHCSGFHRLIDSIIYLLILRVIGIQAGMADFELTPEHQKWCKRMAKRHRVGIEEIRSLAKKSEGFCQLSNAKLHFDKASGTPKAGRGYGVHACYASIDHVSPGSSHKGIQIVCYALNDLKGHLPHDCFLALCETEAWKSLMSRWRDLSSKGILHSPDFYQLLNERSEEN